MILFAGLSLVPGVSITNLEETITVGTHMGAKLACSGRYVSGFDEARVASDISSYSPVLNYLDIKFQNNRAMVSMFGLAKASATYRQGLGCTLDLGETTHLDLVNVDETVAINEKWPLGDHVETIQPDAQHSLDEMLRKDNEAGLDTRALLVVKDGQIVAESYGQGIDTTTPLLGWSMGKSVTAMILGNMELAGKQPSPPLFDDWQDERKSLTLQNLLQMSSGLDWDETYAANTDATRMLFLEPSASAYALQSALAHPPGSKFYYSSGTANLLAKLVFDWSGGTPQANADYFYKTFSKLLGLTTTVFEVDPSGTFVGSSYIYASARDWARMGYVMANNGVINNHQIVSRDWIAKATAPNTSSNDTRYGYQFWLNGSEGNKRWSTMPEDLYMMNGDRAQFVAILPSKNLVIVRLGWTSGRYPVNANLAEVSSWF